MGEGNQPSTEPNPATTATVPAARRAPQRRSAPTATAAARSVSSGAAGPLPSPPPPPAPSAAARARIIHQPCKSCGGAGSVRRQRKLTVSIPAGIDNGQAVSLRGQGGAGKNGGPAGDLLISVTVRPHEFFKRDGTSVYLEHPVTFLQATLGAELEIPTIDGKVKWSLPAGTQPGTTFRLRGKGIPSVNGRGRGDQYVTVNVQVPTGLTHEQKEALRAYGEAMGELSPGPMEGVKSFFDKKKKKK